MSYTEELNKPIDSNIRLELANQLLYRYYECKCSQTNSKS